MKKNEKIKDKPFSYLKMTKAQAVKIRKGDITVEHKFRFTVGDKVKLIKEKMNYSSDLHLIVDKELIVVRTKLSDLGDMLTESIYLQEGEGVRNPYFAELFKKVIDGTNETIQVNT